MSNERPNNNITDSAAIAGVKEGLNRLVHQEIYKINSPVGRALAVIGDKYSLWIIDLLYTQDTLRFVELEKALGQISPRTLSAKLKHLEQHNIVSRTQHPTIPPKVEYSLSEKGKTLHSTLKELAKWSDEWYRN